MASVKLNPSPLALLPAYLVFFLFTTAAVAGEIEVTASVGKNPATVEDSIQLTLTAKGTQNAPQPNLPPLNGFKVRPGGTSSSTQIINGQMSSSISFDYALLPQSTGTFSIPPIAWSIGGKTYTTQAIELKVESAVARPAEENAPVYVTASVSNGKPFVNEQIVYTVKFYRRVEVANGNLAPAVSGFRQEELGKAREYEETVNGLKYIVQEIAFALFPEKPGTQEIPPSTVDVDLIRRDRPSLPGFPPGMFPLKGLFDDPFFRGPTSVEHKTLRSQPLRVEVQPLPEANRPADFANLVGQFNISAELSKKEVELGDSATLTLTISGVGNVRDIPTPELAPGDRFKIYPDHPEFKQWVTDNKIAGGKTVKYALAPLREGNVEIPPIPLSYFDPHLKKYAQARTAALQLRVKPPKNRETPNVVSAPSTAAAKAGNAGRDLLPIHTRIADFQNARMDHGFAAWLAGALLLPPVLFFGVASYTRRRAMRNDASYIRRRSALKQARLRLAALSSASGAGAGSASPREMGREISRIVRECIGDRLDLAGSALTPAETEAVLRARQIPDEAVRAARELLEQCEALQYASGSADNNPALLEKAEAVLKSIEGLA